MSRGLGSGRVCRGNASTCLSESAARPYRRSITTTTRQCTDASNFQKAGATHRPQRRSNSTGAHRANAVRCLGAARDCQPERARASASDSATRRHLNVMFALHTQRSSFSLVVASACAARILPLWHHDSAGPLSPSITPCPPVNHSHSRLASTP
ncbi:hypothetical protein IQ07DRAFT_601042 [Pyrenochaeta sp. DS3sAY3a]|nr:hypothetical protein IQ07DRAFT_601042 [Pyrenochaeta sp. DS3sAY3a]